jgi:hypothetical protein
MLGALEFDGLIGALMTHAGNRPPFAGRLDLDRQYQQVARLVLIRQTAPSVGYEIRIAP